MLSFYSPGPENPVPSVTIVPLAAIPEAIQKRVNEKPEEILNIFPTLPELKPVEYARDPVKCFTHHFAQVQIAMCAHYKISPQQWLKLFEGKDLEFIEELSCNNKLFANAVHYGNYHLLTNASENQLRSTLTLAMTQRNYKTVAALIAQKRDAIPAKQWEESISLAVNHPKAFSVVKLILDNCYDKLNPHAISDSFAVSCQHGDGELTRAFLEKLREEDFQERKHQNDIEFALKNALKASKPDALRLLLARPRFRRYFNQNLIVETLGSAINLPKLQFLLENYHNLVSDDLKRQIALNAAEEGNRKIVNYLLAKYVWVYTRSDRENIIRELQEALSREANNGNVVKYKIDYAGSDALLARETNFLPLTHARQILAKQTEQSEPPSSSDDEDEDKKKKRGQGFP